MNDQCEENVMQCAPETRNNIILTWIDKLLPCHRRYSDNDYLHAPVSVVESSTNDDTIVDDVIPRDYLTDANIRRPIEGRL